MLPDVALRVPAAGAGVLADGVDARQGGVALVVGLAAGLELGFNYSNKRGISLNLGFAVGQGQMV